MDHSFIAHQNVGDAFSGIYYVESSFVKLTVHNKEYTDLVLKDISGSRNVKYWGVSDIGKGDFCYVSCVVQDYQGTASIVAKNIQKEPSPEDLSPYVSQYDNFEYYVDRFSELSLFIAESAFNYSEEISKLCEKIIQHGWIENFDDQINAPSSDGSFYGRIGGLLVNSVLIGECAKSYAHIYGLSDKECCLVILAGLLHKIGAIDCYTMDSCVSEKTNRGILIGEENLTNSRLLEIFQKCESELGGSFSDEQNDFCNRLYHAVCAKNGKIKALTKEALILCHLVEGDNKIVEAIDFISNDENEGKFTAYNSSAGQFYLK